ncbi:response regulator transcription factor [Siculibacillus lacustris]|uniref:Response regulator transcription factor n=1 Tax=Siculibacillus lacustris TaxID=1549641 RepID=A0A4Q9VY19_9HYPH|nr:response regulator transcription factor [Siculibacillus lacustris]TBW40865.1 response regulator transcription factor [Siculibacillus lacustris]
MSTFLIVEDDALHRSFLREVILLSDLGCTRLVEAEDGEAAVRLAREVEPAGIVMDLQMPKKTGVQAAKAIWATNPAMPIVFWSNYADEAYVRGITKIVPACATYGYLLKTASKERLLRSIQCVFQEGQNIVDREIRGVQQRGAGHSEGLTDAEYEALLDIAIGLTDQAIATRRRISLRSVQGRLQLLYAKLGLVEMPLLDGGTAEYNSRSRAVAVALMSRLINGKSIEAADSDYRRTAGDDGAPERRG